MTPLPKFDTLRHTWIEITKSEHQHGGKGWEFGTCLWSPTLNKAGSDSYAIMREPQGGDLVLHFYEHTWPDGVHENRFCGFSRVKSKCVSTDNQPPINSSWGYSDKYYRIDLKSYTVLDTPLPIRVLRTQYDDELRAEREASDIAHYPFAFRKDGIRLSQGRYLARCPQRLYDTIVEACGIEIVSDAKGNKDRTQEASDEQRGYREGKRKLKEQYYFVRNPKLAREAKKKVGYVCQACCFDPQNEYGEQGKRLIDCHHKSPLSERDYREWDDRLATLEDVVVLCANCHRLVHSEKQVLSFEALCDMVKSRGDCR
jgi:hypothetical protein